MSIIENIKYLVFLFTILIAESVSANPTVSNDLQEILIQQSERVKSGHDDMRAYRTALRDLANNGDPVAQFLFSVISIGDDNLDNETIVKYLHSSASNGCAGSAGILAIKYFSENNNRAGVIWLKYAAENGDASSQAILGQYYIAGKNGLNKNETEGFAWKRLALKQSYSKGVSSQLKMFELQTGESLHSQSVEARFERLLEEIGIQPFYLCGQSTP
jgi:hypothetical protein